MISHTRQGVRFVTSIGFCVLWYQTRNGGTICYRPSVLYLVISHTRQRARFDTGIGFCVLWYQTRDRRFDFLRALGFASCDITHETGGTIRYGHWDLRLAISHMRQGVRYFTGIGFCILWYHTRGRGTICYGHWVPLLVISQARTGVRFVTGIEFFVLCYHTRDSGYDLLQPLGSASCDITHETGATSCYGHWVVRLVISHTRQGVRFVPGIGFCLWWYHPRDRGYDLLRALGSVSCDITHETGATSCYGHWVVRLVIPHTRQGVRFVTGIGFCFLWYHIRWYDLLRALGSASCAITHKTSGTICAGHWVLRLPESHTRQGKRFVKRIGFCVLWYHTRDRGYDLLRALGSASCDITLETGGTICYGLWDLHLLISQTRRWGTTCCGQLGSASCDITHETGGTTCSGHWVLSCDITHETGSTICYGHWVLRLVISHTRQEVRCVFGNHTRERVYDMLRALGSASCDITQQTGGTICSGHWVLRLLISHTSQGVRFVPGIGFCLL